MTTKILQYNGQVMYQSTYGPLTVEGQADLTVQQEMVTFKENAEEHRGAKLTHDELEEVSIPDMWEYKPYANKDQKETTFPNLDEVIPLVGNVIFCCVCSNTDKTDIF